MAGVTRDISTRVRVVGASKYKSDMRQLADSLTGFRGALNFVAQRASWSAISRVLEGIWDTMKDCVNASIEFDDAITGVAKTTDMNTAELQYFKKDLLDLSEQIPTSATELAHLAETAGQLGIADEDILSFIHVMADLGYSTNMSADEAATALARFANIMGTSASEYENMGSAIVQLGNNFATTESEIVDMATALAGFTSQANMSEADTFGIAAAMSSVGIEAEAGSTAMGTFISSITKAVVLGTDDLEEYAKVAGMTAGEFSRAWEEDSAGTLALMIENMNALQKAGVNVLPILDDMGIKNVRQSKALLQMVSAGDLLTETLESSNAAYMENTALSEEAGRKYANNASQIQIMQNQIDNAKIAAGDDMSGLVMWGVGVASELTAQAREFLEGDRYDFASMWGDADEISEESKKTAENAYKTVSSYIDSLSGLEGAAYDSSMAIIEEMLPGAQAALDALGDNAPIEARQEALRGLASDTRDAAIAENELAALDNKYTIYSHTQQDYDERAASIAALRIETAAYAEALADVQKYSDWNYQVTDADLQKYSAELSDMGLTPEYASRQDLENAAKRRRDAEYAANADTLALLTEETVRLEEEGAFLRDNAGIVDEYTAALENEAAALGIVVEHNEELSDSEAAMANKAALGLYYVQDLQDQLMELTAEKVEAVNEVLSGFDRIELPEATSIEDMDAGLQSQLDYMDSYIEMLDKAQEMGVSGDLLTMLSDGSEESYGILKGLVEGGDDAALELQQKYEAVQARKNEFAEELARAELDVDNATESIVDSMNGMVDEMNQYPEAYAGAYSTVQGAIDGIDALLPSLTKRSLSVKSLIGFGGTQSTPTRQTGGYTYISHASGLDYVPYDEYPAMLHRGEMVLTALEARAYRSMEFARSTPAVRGGDTANYMFGDVYVREEEDTRRIAKSIARLSRKRAYGKGQRG